MRTITIHLIMLSVIAGLPVPALADYPLITKSPRAIIAVAKDVRPGEPGTTAGQEDPRCQRCVDRCIQDNQERTAGVPGVRANCLHRCRIERAERLLYSDNSADRIEGIGILNGCGGKQAVELLIQALTREFRERRGLFAWIIPALGAQGDPDAVPVLVEALEITDDDWLGREKAAAALGRIGDPSAIDPLVAASWRPDTRYVVLEALAGFRDPRAIPVFLSALTPEEDEEVRSVALAGLRRLGPVAVPQLIEAFNDVHAEYPETEKRVSICRLLGESGDSRALSALRAGLDDPDRRVRECAASFVSR